MTKNDYLAGNNTADAASSKESFVALEVSFCIDLYGKRFRGGDDIYRGVESELSGARSGGQAAHGTS